ncbi:MULTISPECIES: AI-2E family transporter [Paenibacillus]|uniref:AI-2E family transporter n=1 Tax=Paenibacillus popilliae TaxID=78057 RepID=A0ABY3ATJ3_PAEPP|nr:MULTISPECIES: AI-2E family transporter [Paenibacillus]TQR43899.1 AI-2E family transporter [Paenibacillus sp. SDF0028]
MLKNRRTLRYLGLFTIAVIVYKLIDNIAYVLSGVVALLSMLTPFFIACFIAYLLRPLVNLLEKRLLARTKSKRFVSIIAVYTLFFGIIVLLITVITPRVIESVSTLLADMPIYMESTKIWLQANVMSKEWFIQSGISSSISEHFSSVSSQISDFLKLMLNNLLSSLFTFTSALLNLVIGFIVSIYLLKDKEKIGTGAKRTLHGLLKKERAEGVIDFVRKMDMIFSQYFVGVILDATVVGSIVFIGLLIIQAPYALLSALLVAITNVIPYFGPFMGMLFVGIITLFVSPEQTLWITLFIFIVQQFDGYYIGPKIVGNKVGIGPIWIIFAIIIGGAMFGILGMFIAVPVVAVLKTAVDSFIQRRIGEQ